MTNQQSFSNLLPDGSLPADFPRPRIESKRPVDTRWQALAFVLAGVLFAMYPILRPYSSEAGFAGAEAFASARWVEAHACAIGGFILLCFGFLGLDRQLRRTSAARMSNAALLLSWLAVGLTVAYYGAEAFSLHALGITAIQRHDGGLIAMKHAIRFGPGIGFILTGLILLALACILFAVCLYRSNPVRRWSGVPLALVMVLYLPQFAGPAAVRITYGIATCLACGYLAIGVTALGASGERAR
jgi:hypothetical protein